MPANPRPARGQSPPATTAPSRSRRPPRMPQRVQERTPHSPTPLTAFFMVAAILGGCTTHPSRRGEARRVAKRVKTRKPPDSGKTTELGASHPPLQPSQPAGCPQTGHGNAQSSLRAALGTSQARRGELTRNQGRGRGMATALPPGGAGRGRRGPPARSPQPTPPALAGRGLRVQVFEEGLFKQQ